jgi:hypothetical protein
MPWQMLNEPSAGGWKPGIDLDRRRQLSLVCSAWEMVGDSLLRNARRVETHGGPISAAEPRGASQIRFLRSSEPKWLQLQFPLVGGNTSWSLTLVGRGPGAAFSGRPAKGGFSQDLRADGRPSVHRR